MRFAGRMIKVGQYWAIEVPILDVVTQGKTRKEAYEMIADAIESLVNKDGFIVDVFPEEGEYFEIGSKDQAAMIAFLLRQQRSKRGLSLAQMAKRLGVKSINAYARYEQGKSVPTVEKFNQLLSAVSPENDFVIMESQSKYKIDYEDLRTLREAKVKEGNAPAIGIREAKKKLNLE